ncbi:MAG: hypothetical protein WA655_07800 [Candidatus Korobacteraceae bacterium]
MTVQIKCECPKCHADKTMLDTSFGVPGYTEQQAQTAGGESINTTAAVPVRLILCPRCHYVELYPDVGLGKLCGLKQRAAPPLQHFLDEKNGH